MQPDISGYNIHHYFVAKAFRMLNVGGYLAMILPCYWLDNAKSHTRNIVAENGGRLVASWRFPSDMFENAYQMSTSFADLTTSIISICTIALKLMK